jgi:HD-GYP domain-containing protein (c-di-GMP phosphodiesterase class II)
MKSVVDQIIRAVMGLEPLVVNLASIRTKDGYLYQHALDVTITAVMLATRLKFSQADIQEMALGCFLMDLGMIIVPEALLDKKELTAAEAHLIREHPAVGFTILRANEGVPINAAHVAYQHHERLDGAGYPRGLKGADQFPAKSLSHAGGQLHRYAQVAAVADRYISAISPRPGPFFEPLTPTQAMQLLITDAGTRLNTHVVNALITMVPAFPVGTRVVVTKSPKPFLVGHAGVVSRSNPAHQEKPQVLLMLDKFKRRIQPMMVDLAEEKDFEIQFAAL